MAEITLREYVKSVDQLIEREKLDEAIAHSRYILETYPKHLDTYRLLGKAYLEAKRYGDSADIFQRVLSAVPDDFVAHIGMAIVREDEGNLDAAIWHMERAFETNPANPAIQQELKRLIGRRDGLEPHKVRLTRGALARMYAHGDLFPQAIAELRSALQEDPDRPDLQVLLAEMYWRTDQRAEAAEVCNQVLQKLPYCREANRTLAAILHSSGKVDEAAAYHRRLAALDPYAAYVENATVDPGTVDAGSLRMERLEWQAGRPLPAAPPPASDWASTLGLEDETGAELATSAETPEWLASAGELPSTQEERPKPEPTAEPVLPFGAAAPPSEEIPEWMAEAGWAPATGEAREGPVSFSDDELSSLETEAPPAPAAGEPEDGGLAPAEIPDWLQDKAPPPEELLSESVTPEPAHPGSRPKPPDWLSSVADEEEGFAAEPAGRTSSTDRTPTEPEGFPEDEAEFRFGAESAGEAAGEEEAPAIPTWLEEVTPGATSTIVTWLGDRAKEGPKASEGGELPSWMKRAASDESAEGGRSGEGPEAPASEAPSWLEEVEETSDALFGEERREEGEKGGPPTPAWLFGVAEAAAQDASPDLEEVSEFLQEEQAQAPGFEPTSEPKDTGGPAQPAAPDWIRAIASSEREPMQEPAFEESPADEASTDWLRGLSGEAEKASPEAPAADWLEGLAEGAPPGDVEPSQELDWLEGLGEPAQEATTSAAVPDWLDGLGETGVEASEEEAAEVPGFMEPSLAEPGAPELAEQAAGWLDDLGTAGEIEEEMPVGSVGRPMDDIEGAGDLDWLEDVRATAAGEEVTHAASRAEAEEGAPGRLSAGPVDDDEVFRWLEDLAAKQGEEEPEASEVTAIGAGALTGAQEPAIRADIELPEEPGEGLEWLEKLAAERGLPDEEIVSEEAELFEEAEAAPDWMLDTGVKAAPEPVEGRVDQADEDEALGWLEAMAQEEPSEPASVGGAEDEMYGPDWLVTMAGEAEGSAEVEMGAPVPAEEEGLGWLEEMTGETGGLTELPGDDEFVWTQFDQTEVPQDGGVSGFTLGEMEGEYESDVLPLPEGEAAPIEEPDEEEVLEWLTRMSAESNQALEESQAESEEPPEWLSRTTSDEPGPAAAGPGGPELPPPGAPPPRAEPPEAAAAPEWLRIPAEDIPAPQPPTPPDWPQFEPAPTPAAPPSAEVPPVAPAVPPAPPAAVVPPVAPAPPPAPPAAVVPPVTPAVPPAPPAAEVPPVAPAPPPAPPTAEVPPVAPAPPPAPPAAEVPPVAPAPPPAPPAAEVPPVAPAPPPAPPAAEVPPVAPAPPPAPPAAEAPPVAPAPPPAPPAAEVPPVAPAPPSPPSPKAGREPGQMLDSARTSLAGGEVEQAIKAYTSLIKRRSQLPNIIADLKAAVELDPDAVGLWQVLGDAYMKNDQVNDAIEAYRRGMEVA